MKGGWVQEMGENCPVSCCGEPAPSLRHAAKGTTVQVQHTTQMGMQCEVGLGAEESTSSDEGEDDDKWGFPRSWPTYIATAAIL